MIVCKQCGHHNEDSDTFCGSCGKFLEWTGERVAAKEPEPAAAPPPPPDHGEPQKLGLIDRVKQAVFLDEPAAQSPPRPFPVSAEGDAVGPAPAATSAPGATTAPVVAGPRPGFAPAATPAPEPVLAGVATQPSVPATTPAAAPAVAEPDEPASRQPTSVAPAPPRPRPGPRTLEAPARRHPGDLICGQCGEGNDPTRHFCRRCGNSLDEAVSIGLPWHKRFFNWLLGRRTREAGWRPRRVGPPNVMGAVWRIVRLVIGAILIVGVLAFLLVPPFHDAVWSRATAAVTTVRKAFFPRYDAVYPVSATASSFIVGHPPSLAIDKFNNTYWGALPTDHTPYLTLNFAESVDLAQIGFDAGASGAAPADGFLAHPRPHQVHLVFSNGTTADLTLKDQDALHPQFYAIDGKHVTSVTIQVISVYAPAGASASSVAITEVEFRVRD